MASEFDNIELTTIGDVHLWSHPVAKQLLSTRQVDPDRTLVGMLANQRIRDMGELHWVSDIVKVDMFCSTHEGDSALDAFTKYVSKIMYPCDMLLFEAAVVNCTVGRWAIYRLWANTTVQQWGRNRLSQVTLNQLYHA